MTVRIPIFPMTPTLLSNLHTMIASSKLDPRQTVPDKSYVLPTGPVRELRAKLILEEALETINALGYKVTSTEDGKPTIAKDNMHTILNPLDTVLEIIDGCCDLMYVAEGTMVAMGVFPLYHMIEVCDANNAKFPNGVGVTNENGKFQKPKGWQPPNHQKWVAQPHPILPELYELYKHQAMSETIIPLPNVEVPDDVELED